MAKHSDKTAAEEMGQTAERPKREHKATYAKDKLKGGYVIRVTGPNANRFAGRSVPVTRKDDSESTEELDSLLWTGKDEETGKPVALYSFKPRPKDEEVEELPF